MRIRPIHIRTPIRITPLLIRPIAILTLTLTAIPMDMEDLASISAAEVTTAVGITTEVDTIMAEDTTVGDTTSEEATTSEGAMAVGTQPAAFPDTVVAADIAGRLPAVT